MTAIRALHGNRLLGIAVVAMQMRRVLVQRHARIAAAAFGHPATFAAGQQRRKATSVDEHQHLLTLIQMLVHGLNHRFSESGN